MADLKSELIYIRVLEHDTCDQIRIGHRFPIFKDDIKKTVDATIRSYGERMAWCGGWTDENNNKYHERIALVDADTLQPVREIWKRKH